MGKLFGLLAIVGAALSGLFTFLVSGPTLVVLPLLAIATSVVMLVDRRALAVMLALVLLILGVIALPGGLTSCSSNSGTTQCTGGITVKGTSFNFFGQYGVKLAVGMGLLLAMALLAVEARDLEPRWIVPAGAAVLAGAFVWVMFIDINVLGSLSRPAATALPGIIGLLGVVPGVYLLRGDPPAPRPASASPPAGDARRPAK